MTTFIKVNVHLLVVLLVLQLLPSQAWANESDQDYPEVTLSSTESDLVELFEEETKETVLTSIPNGTIVKLLEEKEPVSLIRYTQITPDAEPQEWTGFVNTSTIEREEAPEESTEAPGLEETVNGQEPEEESSKETLTEEEPLEDVETAEPVAVEPEEVEETETPETATEPAETKAPEVVEEQGELAAPEKAEETPVIEELEVQKETTKDIEKETKNVEKETEEVKKETKVQPATKQARVAIASVAVASETLQGIALDSSTKVYKQTNKSSATLKTYAQGKILKFQTHNSEWFSATVYVSGKAQKGYLHKSDVDLLITEKKVNGYAVVESVKVYQDPTATAKVMKTYKFGQAMVYRTFSSKWHKVTVILNGKAETGYIPASTVGTKKLEELPASKDSASSIKGVAVASTVSVYSTASKSSTKLKSYKAGHILTFKLHNTLWYKATVYVNGKAKTGYISKNDVEQITTKPQTVKGIGTKSPTRVYTKAAVGASTLKSYAEGSALTYKTYTATWFQATVIVNGKAQTGYIHKNDVEKIIVKPEKLKGVAIKSPTKVYAKASTGSKVLKSYSYASSLTFKTFTSDWYEATFYVNGNPQIGYFSKNDVALLNGKVVFLDPGHGGKDPGASGHGIVEKTLVLDIGLRAEKLLKSAGFTVLMTRKTDVFLELAERSRLANASKADAFVSIHANAFNGSAKGIETFWYDKYEEAESKRLATLLQSNLVDQIGLSNRRVAEGNYHVIRETKAPSALVEVGFLDNAIDAAKLKLDAYKQRAAEGIFAGILKFFT